MANVPNNPQLSTLDQQNPQSNQNNQQPQQPQQPGQPLTNRQQQQRGTGFTNIGRILGANQGAGQRIGQAISGKLTGQAQDIRQGIQQGQANFQAGQQNAVNTANQNIGAGKALIKRTGENGESDTAYANRIAGIQGDLTSQGQALQNTEYTGPTGIQNAEQLQAKAATVGALGKMAGSSAGQGELLRNFVARKGNYTSGQQGLDQLLVGTQGQNAIQQGRQAVSGLEQQTGNATSSAEALANAAKQGIDTNRVSTLQALRDQITGKGGFEEQATAQAADFQKNANRLSQLLKGVDETGKPITQISADDQKLLDNAKDYGLDTSNELYMKDPAAVQNAINQLSTTATNFGSEYYKDNQKQAATNLSKFLNDQQLQDQLASNKFDTQAFKTDPTTALAQLNAQKQKDLESKDILTKAAGTVGGLEQKLTNTNSQLRDQALATINQRTDLDEATRKSVVERINRDYDESQRALLTKNAFRVADPTESFGTNQAAQSLFQQVNPNFQTAVQGTEETNNPYAGYGFLLYGDRGEQDIDPRFRGLGLSSQGTTSGMYRSSSQLADAANKAVGTSQSLRDYILSKYIKDQSNNQGQAVDLNSPSSGVKQVT